MNIARTIFCSAALFAALTVASPPTMGEDAAVIAPTKDAKDASYSKRSVCKKETVVGTRISKTVCQTAAQRDATTENGQKFLKDAQNAGSLQSKSMN
jgi:hypothetical protein